MAEKSEEISKKFESTILTLITPGWLNISRAELNADQDRK
jgi:hypothetical protein